MVTRHISTARPRPVRMRTAYYPWSGSHGQLFRPCKVSSAWFHMELGFIATFGFASGVNGGVYDLM